MGVYGDIRMRLGNSIFYLSKGDCRLSKFRLVGAMRYSNFHVRQHGCKASISSIGADKQIMASSVRILHGRS